MAMIMNFPNFATENKGVKLFSPKDPRDLLFDGRTQIERWRKEREARGEGGSTGNPDLSEVKGVKRFAPKDPRDILIDGHTQDQPWKVKSNQESVRIQSKEEASWNEQSAQFEKLRKARQFGF